MRKVTKYYKRIRAGFLQAAIFIMFIYVFFIPNVTGYVSQGDNYFTVFLNGTQIGYMGETDAIDDIVREARAKVALQSEEMVYARADVEVIAEEVYFGRIDTYRTLVERAVSVLEDSIIETLGHAYTLKMNEYSVNLADSEEVITLLEASLSEYDTENAYQVNLVLDPTRELNALTAEVVNAREQEAQEELPTFPQAGTEQYFSDLFAAIAPCCGGGQPWRYMLIKNLPIWAAHGDCDSTVPVSESIKMFEAAKKAGLNPRLTIQAGRGHDSWTEFYENTNVIEWMLGQKRGEAPKRIMSIPFAK